MAEPTGGGALDDPPERRRAGDVAAALAEVSRAMSRSVDPDTMGRLAADSIRRLLDAYSAAVYRYETTSGGLVLFATSGPAPEWFPPGSDPDEALTRLAVQQGRPLVSPDVTNDPRITPGAERPAAAADAPHRAVLALPLTARDHIVGAVTVCGRTGRIFAAEEVALAQAFADQAAQALDTAHLVADLRASRDFLASIAENSADAIVTVGVDGRITYLSPGGERMFGYRVDELIGRPASDLYASGPEEAAALMDRLLIEERIGEYETRLRTKDGRVLDVSSSVSLQRDAAGAVVGRIAVVRDMTERKRMELSLRQSEKLAAMGSLLAGVAHELNNPLSIIAGHAAMLKQTATDERLRERATKIGDAVARCARIIKNFLALARQTPPERRTVQINSIVREALELLAYPLRLDDIEVTLDLAPDVPALWADAHQLHQVVVNLLTNAHHALREREEPRRLTVASRAADGGQTVVLDVCDNGPGIPPAIRTRIFEPFFTTKPAGKGTGLGLPLCQSIVAEHGGAIDVASEPGRGATFSVRLPVAPPDRPPADEPPAAAADAAPGRCTVLVVDDEWEVASVLVDVLALDGHDADTVSDGLAALEKLGRRAYDVIFSDLRMPGLDGPALYREVARRYPHLASRFVFLTGDALGDETRAFLASVRAPHLGKPFTLGEVARVLHHVVARSSEG